MARCYSARDAGSREAVSVSSGFEEGRLTYEHIDIAVPDDRIPGNRVASDLPHPLATRKQTLKSDDKLDARSTVGTPVAIENPFKTHYHAYQFAINIPAGSTKWPVTLPISHQRIGTLGLIKRKVSLCFRLVLQLGDLFPELLIRV
jgi:hypothetical protein